LSLLNKDQILSADDSKTRDVDVPEWGGTVRVRGLSGIERDEYEQEMVERRGKRVEANLRNARARLVALCAIDEDGARLFTNSDVRALGAKSAAALNRVYEAASVLSGLTEDDLEELAENFSEATGEDSYSV